MTTKLFSTVRIALDVAAAIVYVAHGDLRHFIYWISAAVLTTTVTY